MIRIFLVILAVVAVVLGVVLSQPVLYAVAGALTLFALFWVLSDYRHKFGRTMPVSKPSHTPASPEDELKSLGIMEIRPKAATRVATTEDPKPQPHADPASDGGLHEPAVPSPTPQPQPASPPSRPAPAEAKTSASRSAAAAYRFQVLQPYLQALRGALEAHTTCLLKQQDEEDTYHIEAASSRSADVRQQGHFTTQAPLLDDPTSGVQVRSVGASDFPTSGLKYYRDALPVRQVALTVIPGTGSDTYVLLADTLEPTGLSGERQHLILSQFAALLGTLLTPMADAPAEEPDPDESLAEEEMDAPRPRRDIIADEIDEARADELALALALIHLNEAEAIAAAGAEALAAAEAALADRIQAVAPDSRLELFGELTYGVFFRGPITDFDAWAVHLRDGLTLDAGADESPVSIGIALLQDRHDSPEAFRADAMDALREAYESGTCTILE